MKILLTGGCGFIGTNIALRCLDEGWDVCNVDWDINQVKRANEVLPTYKVCADFASDKILDRVRDQEFDVILHQAAVPRVSYSVENPAETNDVNVTKTVQLLEAAAGNCRRFVFASSSSIYGGTENLPTPETEPLNPQSPYALQKRVGEDYIRMMCEFYGLDAICLRYFNVFGPHQFADNAYATVVSAWCGAVSRGEPLRLDGTGEQSRDMCHVQNVVNANILAATSDKKFKGEACNIACDDRVSLLEILDVFKKRWNVEVNHAPPRAGDIMHTRADISYAKELIGYEPEVQFWDGLESTFDWWGISNKVCP